MTKSWIRTLSAVLTMMFAVGCASSPNRDPEDPWEGFNRSMFWFNEKADIYVLRPVAVGWDWMMPDLVQTGLRNMYANYGMPVSFLNNLLQAKPLEATRHLGRFLLNTTLGVGGLLTPADSLDLDPRQEDFGQTLGYWGVPPGPYLVLPFIGPGSPRHTAGRAADSASQPVNYFVPWYVTAGIAAPNVINTRARFIEEIDENRRSAVDFYVFQRNAYTSYRKNLVEDAEEDEETDKSGVDLYYYEDAE